MVRVGDLHHQGDLAGGPSRRSVSRVVELPCVDAVDARLGPEGGAVRLGIRDEDAESAGLDVRPSGNWNWIPGEGPSREIESLRRDALSSRAMDLDELGRLSLRVAR